MIAYTNTPIFISEAIQRASFVTVSFVENVVNAIIRNMRYNNMVSSLDALDDRMLKDIGLERNDIKVTARKLSR